MKMDLDKDMKRLGVVMVVFTVAIIAAVVLITNGLVSNLRQEAAESKSATQKWAADNDCHIAEDYFGVAKLWVCADGSRHWKGPL